MKSPDWRAIRAEFPALRNRAFLNTATYGQLPRTTSEAVIRHLSRRDEKACTDFLDWFDDLGELRASIARLIHASPEDIAFIPAAGQALALVISGFDWQRGDEILTLKDEFPNQLYAAQSTHGVYGVECSWNEFEQHLTPRTRLVLMSTVNYVTGLRPNLVATIHKLQDRGIVVYLDGTQSIGALEFDCAAAQPDFLAVDAYKWMISPNGAGFVYVHPRVRNRLKPNVIGWRSDRDWRNVDNLHHGAPRFIDSAEKYEGGMLPFPSLYAMKASLQLMEEIGHSAIEARVLELAALIRGQLDALGAEFYSQTGDCLQSQIILARLPGTDSSELARELVKQRIHISARKGYLRISAHFYNDEEDVHTLMGALRRCQVSSRKE